MFHIYNFCSVILEAESHHPWLVHHLGIDKKSQSDFEKIYLKYFCMNVHNSNLFLFIIKL